MIEVSCIKEPHCTILQFEYTNNNRIEVCKSALRYLIFGMINPKNSVRINLLEASKRIKKIIAYYDGVVDAL